MRALARPIRTLTLAIVLGAASGCIVPMRGRGQVEVVYAVREPPTERVEGIPAAPGPAYVWIKGHWAWRSGDYEWIKGRWEVPAAGLHEWVPGHYEHEARGWFYVEGHWR